MNNCESDSIRFWRAIIQSNNELLEQYNSLYNKLSELLALLESCCEDKNDLYNEIIQQLDTLIQNLIDCCKAICDRLDDIIDILIDPIPTSLIGYEIVFKDHICYQNDEDDYPEAWEVGYDNHTCEETETWPPEDAFWLIEYDEHTCEVREPFIPETEWRVEYDNHTCYIEDEDWPLIGYNLEYSNHVCENVWECDVEGEIIDITEDEVSIEYDGLFTDFTCVLYEGQDSFGNMSMIGEGLLTIEAETSGFEKCVEYGLLYNWYAVTDARILENEGWGIPSNSDIEVLTSFIGSPSFGGSLYDEAYVLKESGLTYWDTSIGTNEYNFNGRGSGVRGNIDGSYTGLLESMYFWLSDRGSYGGDVGKYMRLYNDDFLVFYYNLSAEKRGYSIRLLKDSTTLSHGETGEYIGNDGRIYKTICIGTQEWLAENLMETRFRNGDIIPWHGANPASFFTNAEWAALTTAGVCAYNNDVSLVGCNFTGFPAE